MRYQETPATAGVLLCYNESTRLREREDKEMEPYTTREQKIVAAQKLVSAWTEGPEDWIRSEIRQEYELPVDADDEQIGAQMFAWGDAQITDDGSVELT